MKRAFPSETAGTDSPGVDWTTVLIASSTALLPSMIVAILGLSLPDIRESLSLSELRGGSLFSIIFIVAIAASSLAGRMSDRIGRRTVLVVGVGTLSLGFALSGMSRSYHLMLPVLASAGLGYGLITPSLYALMSDLLPGRRGLGMGLVSVFYGLGGLVGPVLASAIIAGGGWRAAFFVLGAIGALIAVVDRIAIRVPATTRAAPRPRVSYRQSVNRSTLLLALAELFGGAVFWSTAAWTPTVLRSVKELNLRETGLVMGAWGATPMIGALLLGILSDRFGRKAVILWTAFPAAVVIFVVYDRLGSAGALAAGFFLFGILRASVPPLVIALAQDTASPEAVGTASGIIMSMHYVAAFVAPLVTASLITGTGDMILTMILTSSGPLVLYGGLIAAVPENRPADRVKP